MNVEYIIVFQHPASETAKTLLCKDFKQMVDLYTWVVKMFNDVTIDVFTTNKFYHYEQQH